MNKILLVYEDYADLMNVESTLKKVGFDVIGLTNEYTVAEQVLAFNPDLVIGSGKGGKVSSLGVGKRLKEMHRWQGKSVLIFQASVKPEPQDLIRIRVDMILEAPVPALRLVQVAAKLLGHDESVLQARLNKAASESTPGKSFNLSNSTAVGGKFNTDSESIYIKGRTEDVERSAEERALRAERVQDEEGVNFSLNSEEAAESKKVAFRFGDRMSSVEPATAEKTLGEESPLFADVDLRALERELLGGGAPEVERIENELITPATEASSAVTETAESFKPESADAIVVKDDNSSSDEDSVGIEGAGSSDTQVAQMEAFGAQPPEIAEGVPVTGEEAELREIQAKARQDLESAEKALKNRMERYSKMVADVKVAPKSTVSRVEARRRQNHLAQFWDHENLKELDELRREFAKAMFKK